MVKLVLIEWIDSRQPEPAWKRISELEEYKIVKCASVGWLVKSDKNIKVLAPNMGDIDDASNLQLSGEIAIPSKAVIKMKTLQQV